MTTFSLPVVPSAAQAPAPVIHYVNGQQLSASALNTATPTAETLAGALVTVCNGANCESVALTPVNQFSCEAVGTGWYLMVSGDTFNSPWLFQNFAEVEGDLVAVNVSSLSINLGPARAVFDVNISPKAPNSSTGKGFVFVEGLGIAEEDCIVQYSNKCEIGASGNNDTYEGLAVRFEPALVSTNFNEVLFESDTDQLAEGVQFVDASPPPPPPPPPPAPPVQIRSQAPGPLGVPLVIVGPVWAYAAVPGPLGAPRVLAWDSDFSATVAGLTSFYVMDLETPTGPVRVPISSWQATLRTGSQNYVQCVVPDALPWLEAINSATSFAIYRRALSVSGAAIEVEMARAAVGLVQINEGAQRVTATLSGNSTGFASEPDQLAPASGVLRGVRSASQSSSGLRVRCSIDWLLRPGQIATYKASSFPVRFISYFVSIDDAYMDIAEQT